MNNESKPSMRVEGAYLTKATSPIFPNNFKEHIEKLKSSVVITKVSKRPMTAKGSNRLPPTAKIQRYKVEINTIEETADLEVQTEESSQPEINSVRPSVAQKCKDLKPQSCARKRMLCNTSQNSIKIGQHEKEQRGSANIRNNSYFNMSKNKCIRQLSNEINKNTLNLYHRMNLNDLKFSNKRKNNFSVTTSDSFNLVIENDITIDSKIDKEAVIRKEVQINKEVNNIKASSWYPKSIPLNADILYTSQNEDIKFAEFLTNSNNVSNLKKEKVASIQFESPSLITKIDSNNSSEKTAINMEFVTSNYNSSILKLQKLISECDSLLNGFELKTDHDIICQDVDTLFDTNNENDNSCTNDKALSAFCDNIQSNNSNDTELNIHNTIS